MDALIYEDTPYFDRWQTRRLTNWVMAPVGAVLLILLIVALPLLDPELEEFRYLILAASLILLGIWWARWPRRYQIFDSKIRIVFGRPFHFDIPFNNLEYASEGDPLDMWLPLFRWNFVTSRGKNIVTIVRKSGMKINITPNNPELFLENLRKALVDWRRIYEQ